MKLLRHPLLYLGSVFLLAQILLIPTYTVWWDSAVYVGMGKYLWSFGESGLIETARPLVVSFFVGLFWFIGSDPVVWGTALSIFFGLGVGILTYLIGTSVFDRRVGTLAALFVLFNPWMLFFSHHILSSIPALFFFLLGFYFLLKSHPYLCGVFFGLSFFTRYFHLIFIGIIVSVLVVYALSNSSQRKNLFWILGGIGTVAVPFLGVLFLIHGSFLDPFFVQYFLSRETGLIYSEPFWFYIVGLLASNILLLSIVGIGKIWNKEWRFHCLFWSVVIPLALYSLVAHKEIRLLLGILPFLAILCSAILISFAKKTIRWWEYAGTGVALTVVMGTLFFFSPSLFSVSSIDPGILFMQERIGDLEEPVWVSSPIYALHSDKNIGGLIYYSVPDGTIPRSALVSECDLAGNSAHYEQITEEKLDIVHELLEKKDTFSSETCEYSVHS